MMWNHLEAKARRGLPKMRLSWNGLSSEENSEQRSADKLMIVFHVNGDLSQQGPLQIPVI